MTSDQHVQRNTLNACPSARIIGIRSTEELADRLGEMFETLDVNGDRLLSNEDLRAVTDDSLAAFLGRMEDRLADLTDLIIDQRVDFSLGSFKPQSRGTMVKRVLQTDDDDDGSKINRDEL